MISNARRQRSTYCLVLCLLLVALLTSCQTRIAGVMVPCPKMSEMALDQFEQACGLELNDCAMVQNWVQNLARYCLIETLDEEEPQLEPRPWFAPNY